MRTQFNSPFHYLFCNVATIVTLGAIINLASWAMLGGAEHDFEPAQVSSGWESGRYKDIEREFETWLQDSKLDRYLRVELIASRLEAVIPNDKWGAVRYRLDLSVDGATAHHQLVLQKYEQNTGISLEERLLMKFAHMMDQPVSRVGVRVIIGSCEAPGPTSFLVRITRNGGISSSEDKYGGACWTTGVRSFKKQYSSVARSQGRLLSPGGSSFSHFENFVRAFRGAVVSYYQQQRGIVTVLSDEDEQNYMEITVKGLRGVVIPGLRRWEKVQLGFFYNNLNNSYRVRYILDGQLSSGLGGEPPPNQYKDMEPQYLKPLEEHGQALMSAVQRALNNKER